MPALYSKKEYAKYIKNDAKLPTLIFTRGTQKVHEVFCLFHASSFCFHLYVFLLLLFLFLILIHHTIVQLYRFISVSFASKMTFWIMNWLDIIFIFPFIYPELVIRIYVHVCTCTYTETHLIVFGWCGCSHTNKLLLCVYWTQ